MTQTNSMTQTDPAASEIRPFRVDFPDAALDDLKRRVAATNWPERELVADRVARACSSRRSRRSPDYWATEHDWRKVEATLNAYPQFITEIDGLDIHFIHVRSKHENALPLIVTHGWPGSIIEQLKIIGPLTNPTAHGGSAADAFDLVIPSLPGHGFSGKPTATGWDPIRIARAWITLMDRLGYYRYVAQGGDWGNAVTEQMALLEPAGLDRHPHQYAGDPSRRNRGGAPVRPTRAGRTVGRGAIRLGSARRLLPAWVGLCPGDGQPAADALRARGLPGRAGRLDARSRRAQLRPDRPRLRRYSPRA